MKKFTQYILGVIVLLFVHSEFLFSQSATIRGFAKSGPDGTPIQNQNIFINGDTKITTDGAGNYFLSNVVSGVPLTFSSTYNGFTIEKTITLDLGDNWMNFWFDPPALPSDFDGNYYHTVVIGTQTWMVENLLVTHYLDGSNIPNITDNTAWYGLTTPGYCWYNNDYSANKDTYGALYNWYTVNTGNLCPAGWHVPTNAEWTTLTDYFGGAAVAGGKLKETGTTHWESPNIGATNESGFTALPGGYRQASGGVAVNIGTDGWWWSSSASSVGNAWSRNAYYNGSYLAGAGNNNEYGFSVRCINDVNLPTVTTAIINDITSHSALSGGNISDDGGGAITARGVCWSTTQNLTTSDSHTSDGTGTGSFISSLTGLTPNTTYYVRAYATNSVGTAYGNEISYTTYKSDAITDIEGNYYNIVTIGSQVWMAENLRTTKYNNGSGIPNVTDNATWDALTSPAYAWYDNNFLNKTAYGALYNWYAVETGKLCPVGWHVPTDAQLTKLTNYVGGESIAGGKLKEIGNTHWNSPNDGATDEYGFTALPGGARLLNGVFYSIGGLGSWWSSIDTLSTYAWHRFVHNNDIRFSRIYDNKADGFSVRCIRDIIPIVVSNVGNDGIGSLRYAIEYANSTVGVKDVITFNIPGTGPFTIQPQTPLPSITDPVVIDGFTQKGANNSKLLIELDGTYAGASSIGLSIATGNCTVKGLAINRFNNGISIVSNGNFITGNFIGTDVNGTIDFGNSVNGISIIGGASNRIGGDSPSDRNIISGNFNGISIKQSNENIVIGNYIGVDVSGTLPLGNIGNPGTGGAGVLISKESSNNTVGGAKPGEGNIISGNDVGIWIDDLGPYIGQPANNNKIVGNYIGTDYSGVSAVGNQSCGVLISNGTFNNQVGGSTKEEGNIIANSPKYGVWVVGENGVYPIGNIINCNSIYNNGRIGIDLSKVRTYDGVTPNDIGDGDTGPNNLQNFPFLDSIKFDLGKKTVFVSGYLESTPNSVFTLQFFTSKTGDNSGYGEGETFLGSSKVTTTSNGKALFGETFAISSSWGDVISATATDAGGNTSEFSEDIGGLQNQIIAANKWPFYYRTNADGVLRITDGSDLIAVDSSFRSWTIIPTAAIDFRNGGTTPTKYASANDGLNLVTFTDDMFPFAPGVLAVAAKTLKLVPGSIDAQIIDADIVVNPLFARNDVGVGYNNPNAGTYDIQSLITHEIGHVLGLLHSGVYNSSMFYILYPGTRVRSLEQDDKSWASYRYPKANYGSTYGSISGNIKYAYDSQSVAGALVLAINTSTKDTVHAYSDASGNYLVPGLRPGSYNIYIEPLDGSSKVHKLKPGNISAYVYCNTVYTDYPGEFYSNPESDIENTDVPKSVTVSAGQEIQNINLITNKDLTGPKIISVYPPKDTTNINVTYDIIITFSEPVDQTSLTDQTCFVESGSIKHGVSYTAIGNSTNIIMVSPDSALKYSTIYNIHITDGVKDLRGNALNPAFQSSFKTANPDLAVPEITGTYPLNSADSVFVMEKVTVFFSKPMNRTSVENNFTLTWAEGSPAVIKKVDGSFTWDDENKSVTFIPSGSLKEGTKYTITVSAAATDLSGNHLANSTFNFTTIPNSAPAIIYLGPQDQELSVTVSTPVVADFSEPIDPLSVNTSTFSLKLNGIQVPGKIEFLNNNSRVVFRPDADLDFGKSYSIVLTTGIKDVSVPSLPLSAGKTATFTTALQPKAPLINYLQPTYGTIGSKVVIVGTGFDPNPLKNSVKFNGTSAAITDATLTTLTTNVPLGALSGMVTVTGINGMPADNSLYFGVIPQSDNPCENIVANAPLGSKSTKDVSVTPDNAFAYVTNPLSDEVTVIDLLKSVMIKSIPVGKTPMKIDINSRGTLAYVTNFNSHDVSVIDLATNKVIRTIKVGIQPYGLAVTPDGKGVYVANYSSENLSLIDEDPNSGGFDHVVANVPTGSKTSNVAISPDAAMVLVTGDFGLKIVDANPKDANYNCVVANVSSGTRTRDVTISPDAGLAIVSTEEGNLLVVNLHPENGDYADAVVANVPAGTKISDVKISGDAMFVYVTATDNNEILVYKLTQGGTGTSGGSSVSGITLALHSTITGLDAPEGLVINSKADKLYVINGLTNNRKVSTISLCCGPVDPANVIGDLITAIQNMINNGSIPAPQGKDLINKLNSALKDLQNNKTKSVINDLNTFINQVQAYIKGHKISASLGQPLIDNANTLIKQLKGIKSATIGFNFTNTELLDIEPVVESKLGMIYPNPSNESFIINYEIAGNNEESTKVMIRVYDINGGTVKTLVDRTMQTGRYSAGWNSNYDNGNRAPGGTYFVHFRTGNVETVGKIILIR